MARASSHPNSYHVETANCAGLISQFLALFLTATTTTTIHIRPRRDHLLPSRIIHSHCSHPGPPFPSPPMHSQPCLLPLQSCAPAALRLASPSSTPATFPTNRLWLLTVLVSRLATVVQAELCAACPLQPSPAIPNHLPQPRQEAEQSTPSICFCLLVLCDDVRIEYGG